MRRAKAFAFRSRSYAEWLRLGGSRIPARDRRSDLEGRGKKARVLSDREPRRDAQAGCDRLRGSGRRAEGCAVRLARLSTERGPLDDQKPSDRVPFYALHHARTRG